MVKNRNKVPLKQWRRWSAKARKAFNEMYRIMRDQGLMSHPKAVEQKPEHWTTTRWNSAWLAADAVDGKL